MNLMIREDLNALPAYVPGTSVPGALKLASNETTQNPLPTVVEAIEKASHTLNRYPPMAGSPLHRAIAEFHGVTEDMIALGAGSCSVLQQLIHACCTEDSEVLFAWRSFEAYPIMTQIAGATPVKVPLASDYRHDLDAMAAAATDRTSVVMICNPNNPTGTIHTQEEIEAFLAALPSHVTVCIDEAYIDYVSPDLRINAEALVAAYPNVAIARTFSKCYGLAGARLGYMIARPELITAINKTSIPFSVSSLAHAAGEAALGAQAEKEERVAITMAERSRLLEFLHTNMPTSRWKVGVDAIPQTHANFVFLDLGEQGPAFAQALAQEGVLVRCYGADGVRITVTTPEETDVLIKAVENIL